MNLFIDFDDTLYDTYGNAKIALSELFDEFGWARYFDRLEDFTLPYWQCNIELWSQYAKGRISRPYLLVERFRRPLSCGHHFQPTTEYCLRVSDRFLDLCRTKPGTVPGAHHLMDHLRSRGHRLHLCSNGFREVQYSKLRASRLLHYFDTIILSDDAGANKPLPQFFAYALSQSGATLADTIMIGDNFETDILGAHAFGLRTIYFNRYPRRGHPELPVATWEVHALSEIEQIL